MRTKPFHSCSKAFSFLEMVLVLGIISILALLALPQMSVGKKPCIYELRAKLATANAEFLAMYERHITQRGEIEYESIMAKLLEPINPQCYFSYQKKLVAHIGREKLSFIIAPQDLTSKPKIYCSLSSALCREFWGKTLKK